MLLDPTDLRGPYTMFYIAKTCCIFGDLQACFDSKTFNVLFFF